MRALRWTALAILPVLLGGCTESRYTVPRLVLLYAPCTVNKNYLSPYDPDVPYTPHLRQFAEDGLVFTNHYTEAGSSGIAYASLFTGTQADRHGVYRHPARLRSDAPLIFETFARLGYKTHYWNQHFAATSGLNYAEGVPRGNYVWGLLEADHPRFRAILDRLRTDDEYRALVVTNFAVTHAPYRVEQVEEFQARYPAQGDGVTSADISRYHSLYSINVLGLSYDFEGTTRRLGLDRQETLTLVRVLELLYKSNVAKLDRLFDEVIDAIDAAGLAEESLIAFTADHGEVLYSEHAVFPWAHSLQLANDALNVPLIIRSPAAGVRPGRYTGISRSIDVYPTLVGLAGGSVPPDAGVQGIDLSEAMRGRAAPPPLTAYMHTSVLVRSMAEQMSDPALREQYGRVPLLFPTEDVDLIWVSMRAGDVHYKLRRPDGKSWRMAAFDLATDPAEAVDIWDPVDPAHREARAKLRAYKARLVVSYGDRPERLLPSAEEREGLRSLGYIQ
jgi:arylsulfatase A-like enzyme